MPWRWANEVASGGHPSHASCGPLQRLEPLRQAWNTDRWRRRAPQLNSRVSPLGAGTAIELGVGELRAPGCSPGTRPGRRRTSSGTGYEAVRASIGAVSEALWSIGFFGVRGTSASTIPQDILARAASLHSRFAITEVIRSRRSGSILSSAVVPRPCARSSFDLVSSMAAQQVMVVSPLLAQSLSESGRMFQGAACIASLRFRRRRSPPRDLTHAAAIDATRLTCPDHRPDDGAYAFQSSR